MATATLSEFLAAERARVDALLPAYLPPEQPEVRTIHESVRYSLLLPGKRVRPILCLHVAELLGGGLGRSEAEPAAVAFEMIHCYSLIHDDLPAMDDDDLRRGQPTNHKVYGEAIAILAGDALLTLAFETLARTPSPDLVPPLLAELGRAAGVAGMVGGQVADIEGEALPDDQMTPERLAYIHRHKTAALIRGAVVCGGIAGRADAAQLAALGEYGEAIGLAFQVADDILDVTGGDGVGKATGKDAAAGKLTYPSIHGLDRAREIADELAARARAAVTDLGLGDHGHGMLAGLADFIVERTH